MNNMDNAANNKHEGSGEEVDFTAGRLILSSKKL